VPVIPVNGVGDIGIVSESDRAPHELPLNAWSAGSNVRMRDGMVEKVLGHQQAFGTLGNAPYFLLPAASAGVYYWLEAGLTKVFVWDGAVHTNITRQTAAVDVDYTAASLTNWTGGVLGGIPILNDGTDLPQMWNPATPATKLAALSNWPATYLAGAMRIYRRFLVALGVKKAGVDHPQMVKWSHPAPSGGVPISWDETDPTKDAGEYEIVDTNGSMIDAAKMRDALVLYKDDSVHLMEFVGGVDVFKFSPLFGNFGILSKRCALEYQKGQHAVFALGDLISHDGNTWESIVDSRMRKWLFNQIDSANFQTSFIALNPAFSEVWFCFPTSGNTLPNLALIWHYKRGTFGVRDLNGVPHIATGNVVLSGAADIWDNDTSTWDSDTTTWDQGTSNPAGSRLLLAQPSTPKLQMADSTSQFDGVPMSSYVERTGLVLPLALDQPPDIQNLKFISDIWPRILGTAGGVVKVSAGGQDRIGGPVTWRAPRDFIIGTTKHLDIRITARLLALKFESTTDIEWRMPGYGVDVRPAGKF
jgi:hypothetical protein